jgi:hypothetical protein
MTLHLQADYRYLTDYEKDRISSSRDGESNLKYVHCGNPSCKNTGKSFCGGCGVVPYCSKECQTASWKDHKKDCVKLPFVQDSWLPDYLSNGLRTHTDFWPGEQFDLWGQYPAVDLLSDDSDISTTRMYLN